MNAACEPRHFRKKPARAILLIGGEASHDDGPWVHPDDYWKFCNGLLTYSCQR